MNKTIIAERFSKAISTYPREANVQRQIADKMIRLLQKHIPSPCPKVIEFGCGTGIYSRMLLRTLRPEELLLNDLFPLWIIEQHINNRFNNLAIPFAALLKQPQQLFFFRL